MRTSLCFGGVRVFAVGFYGGRGVLPTHPSLTHVFLGLKKYIFPVTLYARIHAPSSRTKSRQVIDPRIPAMYT